MDDARAIILSVTKIGHLGACRCVWRVWVRVPRHGQNASQSYSFLRVSARTGTTLTSLLGRTRVQRPSVQFPATMARYWVAFCIVRGHLQTKPAGLLRAG